MRRAGPKVKASPVSSGNASPSRPTAAVVAAVALLTVGVLAIAGRALDTPGLYYDEVIQALPAAEFLRDDGRPHEIPGARSRRLFGGWFPLMTQPYMGALKSQLLIPVFALAGASAESLRLTTLLWSCLGLLLTALWVQRVYGVAAALLCAVLLAADPSFLFVGRHDWGSVALALVLRGGGLYLLTLGWQARSITGLAAGGLLLGLGLFNKIDHAGFLVGVSLAFAATAPRSVWRELRDQPRRLLAAAGGFALGSAPIWISLPGVLGASQAMLASQSARPDDFGEKLVAWAALLDGSYFQRLMLAGGSFERLGEMQAAAGLFGWVFGAAAIFLAVVLARGAARGELDRASAFAWLACACVGLALLAIPRAARIHHVMNVQPLPQLVVALAALRLWRSGRAGARGLAAACVAAALVGCLLVDAATLRTLRESGGRGRWTGALEELAQELPPGTPVVSLDWGFHGPLRFLHPELSLEEPVWEIAAAARGALRLAGTPAHVYLVWEPDYEVFEWGGALLEAVAALPPDSASVRTHSDASGEAAFRSIRFARPHELVYRGSFEVRLR